MLGDTNMDILLSKYPSPEKQEYIVKSGDVLARVATEDEDHARAASCARTNMSGTMLRIGARLLDLASGVLALHPANSKAGDPAR
jgi:hypothetical protein